MKSLSSLLLFFSSLIAIAQTSVWDSVQHQLQWRSFKIHFPPAYTPASHIPLIIALHGGNHDADIMEYITKLSSKADVENFIVVYPNSRSILGMRTWNAGTCCGPSVAHNVDDVGFIVKMVNKLKIQYKVDTNRIYLTGASNGGMLAYRLACERAELFAAVSPVATTMVVTSTCTPSRSVPVLHIHSLPDTRVPYFGGYGTGYSGIYNPPVDSVMNVWANIDSCLGSWNIVYNQNGVLGKGWKNCSGCSEIFVYTTSDGGHSWPGGNQTANGDPPSTSLNATDLMWNFFKTHSLICNPTSVIDDYEPSRIKIFPNVVSDYLNIVMPTRQEYARVIIYNSTGVECFQLQSALEGTVKIPVHSLAKGLYVVIIVEGTRELYFGRFVKP